MSNFLNEDYAYWLATYKFKFKDPSVQLIAGALISKLPLVKSVSELISLLEQHIPKEPTAFYGPINFLAQLITWKTELENLRKNCDLASQVIQPLNSNQKLTPLIRILREQITDPQLQMHSRTQGMLSIICSEQFSNILNFMANLEVAPLPKFPQQGSFAALIPHNSDHAFCLGLLNNLTKKYDHSNDLWSKSNSLLQSTLLICQDMYPIEHDMGDEPFEEQCGCNTCVIT